MLEKCLISGFADEIGETMDEQLETLKKLDLHYIELRAADGKGIASYTEEEAVELKKKLDENVVHVSAIGSPIGKIQITDPFEPHFETFKNVVRMAKIFDTKYIRMFSFFMPEGEDPAKYRDEVILRLKKMIAYAKEQDVVLLHENEKDIYGDIAVRVKDLFDTLGCENFKCTFDFANFVQVKQDTLEAYDLLKDVIHYIHIKDANMETGVVVPAGEGDGHVTEILQMLSESGYEGYLSLEPHLGEFATFKSLEQLDTEMEKKSGPWAYETAYNALKKILA